MSEYLWDVLELDDTVYRFYIQYWGERRRELPAFILIPPDSPLNPWRDYWTLLMNRVGLVGHFDSRKEAFDRLRQMVRKAKKPLNLWILKPGARVPVKFAEKR